MWLLWTIGTAFAADPTTPTEEDPAARARELSRAGALQITGGVAGVAGGLALLLVGRGAPGEISNESQRVSDLRSFGGAALVIGGFTTTLVGGNNLGRAAGYRDLAADVAVTVHPHGVGLTGTF